jgi:hypothetical protein
MLTLKACSSGWTPARDAYNGLANSRFHTLLFGINRLRSDELLHCRAKSLYSGAFSLGLGLALIDSRFSAPSLAILRDMRIVTIGIAMLILLPVVRVIVMLIVYFRQRDYRLAAIALLVLTIILLGFTVGLAESRHRDAPTSPIQARAIPVRSIGG